jgi:ABC-type multidrug transport system ATPase subunit
MDEPTSGLDARAAAIVMRTVRNTVDTGRTVVCTIHQPSIDIFEVHLVGLNLSAVQLQLYPPYAPDHALW